MQIGRVLAADFMPREARLVFEALLAEAASEGDEDADGVPALLLSSQTHLPVKSVREALTRLGTLVDVYGAETEPKWAVRLATVVALGKRVAARLRERARERDEDDHPGGEGETAALLRRYGKLKAELDRDKAERIERFLRDAEGASSAGCGAAGRSPGRGAVVLKGDRRDGAPRAEKARQALHAGPSRRRAASSECVLRGEKQAAKSRVGERE